MATRSKKKAPPRLAKARKGARQKPLFAGLKTPVVQTAYLEVTGNSIKEVKPRGSATDRDEWRHHYVILQLEWVDCGQCPKAHGPYWYGYKRAPRKGHDSKGKLLKVYVGKNRDDAKAVAALRTRGAF